MKPFQDIFAALTAGTTVVSAIQLFETPGDISASFSARCRVALTHNVTCDLLVTTDQAQREFHLVGDVLTGYCNDGCRDSIAAFQDKVTNACGHTLYTFQKEGERKSSAQALVEGFAWAQSLMCIKGG